MPEYVPSTTALSVGLTQKLIYISPVTVYGASVLVNVLVKVNMPGAAPDVVEQVSLSILVWQFAEIVTTLPIATTGTTSNYN